MDTAFRKQRRTEVPESELRHWHGEWSAGRANKNAIERTVLGDPFSHGKLISRLWRGIGLETERVHPLVVENRRLRAEVDRLTALLSQ